MKSRRYGARPGVSNTRPSTNDYSASRVWTPLARECTQPARAGAARPAGVRSLGPAPLTSTPFGGRARCSTPPNERVAALRASPLLDAAERARRSEPRANRLLDAAERMLRHLSKPASRRDAFRRDWAA